MKKTYHQVTFECARPLAEPLSHFLTDSAALAVSLLDAKDDAIYEPALNEMPLWHEVKVVALFDNHSEAEQTLALLATLLEYTPNYSIAVIEEQDWVAATQAQFSAQCFANKLWVYPDWQAIAADHQPALKLAPGLAFGTGTHPTTQMCLEAITDFLIPQSTVIDFGCGSGILGLAALTLGADYVYCVDIDPQALEATKNNALLNAQQEEKLFIGLVAELPMIKVDMVVANILAKPLIELSSLFAALLKSKGRLILAGILDTQADLLIETYRPWITLTALTQKEEWVCLTGVLA